MKLINRLDLNGQYLLNSAIEEGAGHYLLPAASGTLALKEDIIAQHAFVFKGNATSYEHKGDSQADVLWFSEAQKTAAIEAGVRSQDFGEAVDNLYPLASNANSGAYNGFVFQVSDKEYASNGSLQWVELGFNISLENYYTKSETDAKFETITHAAATYATIADVQDNEEVVAQALNDHEARLITAETKLTGIESGAQVNVLEGVQLNGTDLAIANKKVNIVNATPTTSSEDGAAGLMSASDKTKLDGIATGAQVNVIEGVILSDSAQALTPDANKNVTIPNATQSADGLMSSEDKTKLDNIESGYMAKSYLSAAVTSGTGVIIAEQDTTVSDVKVPGHHCGIFPMVQVYWGLELVDGADVTVDQATNGDVTIRWAVTPTAAKPVRIRIVGAGFVDTVAPTPVSNN